MRQSSQMAFFMCLCSFFMCLCSLQALLVAHCGDFCWNHILLNFGWMLMINTSVRSGKGGDSLDNTISVSGFWTGMMTQKVLVFCDSGSEYVTESHVKIYDL